MIGEIGHVIDESGHVIVIFWCDAGEILLCEFTFYILNINAKKKKIYIKRDFIYIKSKVIVVV